MWDTSSRSLAWEFPRARARLSWGWYQAPITQKLSIELAGQNKCIKLYVNIFL